MIITSFLLSTSYFAWAALFNLIYLTYKDYRNNMMVDDRRNWFMMGISLSLISHIPHGLLYILFIIVISLTAGHFLKKYKAIGRADINSLMWLYMGLGIIGPGPLVGFIIIYSACMLFYFGAKKYIFRYNHPTPFYYVILVSFLLSAFMWGLF